MTQSGLPVSVLKPPAESPSDIAPSAPRAETVPAGWWHEHSLPFYDSVADVESVLDDKRRLDAVARYVKDRTTRFEYDAARIVAEMRIGELLGDGVQGQHLASSSPGRKIDEKDRWKFRKLAENRDLVLKLLHQGIASRKRILAKIDEPERPPVSGVELRLGDFRDQLADLDGQVDAIITDPPYAREFLPLYRDLGEVAARILKPGGIAAAMSGETYLPDVLNMLGESLTYRWTMAYLVGGAAVSVHGRRVQTYWKPIVVFEKPPSDINHRIGGDVVRATGSDRDDSVHHWGQNEHGMAQIVERLTEPGTLVVDPFAGGGTTLVVCAALGRSCIGVEVDQDAYNAASERLDAT